MVTKNATLMTQALASLKGKWSLAIGILVVYILIVGGIQAIPKVGGLISFLISPPLALGLAFFSLSIARGKEANIAQLFDGFKNYITVFIAYLLIALLVSVWLLPLVLLVVYFVLKQGNFLVAVINSVSSDSIMNSEEIFGSLQNAGLFVFLFFLLIIPAIVVSLSYTQVYYIIADNPAIKALDAVRQSKEMMKGYKLKYVFLGLRFIGWAILCIFTLGIGLLWLLPYIQVSMARFYDDIKGGVEQQNEYEELSE